MQTFEDFVRELERLDWTPAGRVDPRLLSVLADLAGKPRIVQDLVGSWSTKNLERRQLRCHQTSTHYKWFVYCHRKLLFKIWLHQYKGGSERRVGYAEVPHNHRYSLASAILRGGFMHHYFEPTEGGIVELVVDRAAYSQGDVYAVDWQRVHKLSALQERTVTLVVEGPAVRHYSEAFYGDGPTPTLFYDFVGLHRRLAEDIA